jgi:hypothetical protein
MKNIIKKLAEVYIHLKSRKVLKRINIMLDFPVQSKEVKNILVILPRGLSHLDDANDFVQKLRKIYPRWKIKIFDVDKIDKEHLNYLRVPDREIIQTIRNTSYHMAIDLNEHFDMISAFVSVMSEAAYRITFNKQDQKYFNMQCYPASGRNGFFYNALLDYVQWLFIKE